MGRGRGGLTAPEDRRKALEILDEAVAGLLEIFVADRLGRRHADRNDDLMVPGVKGRVLRTRFPDEAVESPCAVAGNLRDTYGRLAKQAYDKALQIDSGNAGAKNKLALVRELVDHLPRRGQLSIGSRIQPEVGTARLRARAPNRAARR